MGEEKVITSFEEVEIADSDKILEEQPEESPETSEEKKEEPESETTKSDEKDAEKPEKQIESEEKPETSEKDKDKPGEKEEEEQEEPGKKKPEESEVPKIAIGDEEYTQEDIKKALEDSKNKIEWQKANTEQAQESASNRKAVEPLVQIISKLKEEGKSPEDIKEAFIDVLGEEMRPVIDLAFDFDAEKYEHPDTTELNVVKKELAETKSDKIVNAEKDLLKENNKLTDSEVEEVHKFAIEKFIETDQAITLEDAYKLMNYESLKKKAENKEKPPIPNVPSKKQGAKDIKKEKVIEKFEDIDIKEFNLLE